MLIDCIEVVSFVPTVQINAPLVQVWKNQNAISQQLLIVFYHLRQTVVEARLQWGA